VSTESRAIIAAAVLVEERHIETMVKGQHGTGFIKRRRAMKAIAFRSKVKLDGTIIVPKKVRRSVKGEEVRVVLLWPESDKDTSLWQQEGIETFLEGDGQHDGLYDTI